MKKIISAAWLLPVITLGALMLFNACDDRNNSIGIDYLPDYTKSKALNHSLEVDFATISADMSGMMGTLNKGTSYNNIYVTSSFGYLGLIPNLEYGSIECEYLTQFRCPEGFRFKHTPIENKVDSAFITIYYNGFTGDSIAPIEISAYKLTKPLKFGKHSISDVSEYTEGAELLGKVSYYAKKGTKVVNKNQMIQIPLPKGFGQEVYDLSRAGSSHFENQSKFDNYFPGIYLTTSAGAGSIIRVTATALTFYFQIEKEEKDPKSETGKKIVRVTESQELVHTSEVPQLARFANEGLDKLISKAGIDSEYTYIKSPAGVVAEVTIPTKQIKQFLSEAPKGYERILNSVRLSVMGESQKSGESIDGEINAYALSAPADMLLLPNDSVVSFFSKELTDLSRPYTAFISQRSIDTSLSYDFGNITSVIIKHMENEDNQEKDLKMWMIPVERIVTQNPSGTSVTGSISNLVLPSAIKFKNNSENKKLEITVVERKIGAPF